MLSGQPRSGSDVGRGGKVKVRPELSASEEAKRRGTICCCFHSPVGDTSLFIVGQCRLIYCNALRTDAFERWQFATNLSGERWVKDKCLNAHRKIIVIQLTASITALTFIITSRSIPRQEALWVNSTICFRIIEEGIFAKAFWVILTGYSCLTFICTD